MMTVDKAGESHSIGLRKKKAHWEAQMAKTVRCRTLTAFASAMAAFALSSCAGSSNEPQAEAGEPAGEEVSVGDTTISDAATADFPGLATLCGKPSRPLTEARVQERKWEMPRIIPAAKVFDTLYFVGNGFSSAWIVKTDDGLVLIDTLFNGAEAKLSIDEGLRSVGLDPAEIKYVVVSHGHGDHYGGAQYIVDKFGSTMVMSRTDWEPLKNPEDRFQSPGWTEIPTPDILVDDEYDIELGGTTIKLRLAPGHTKGTLSTLLTLKDGDNSHKAILWGGTGYNFGPVLSQYKAYARSADLARQNVLDEGVEVFLSNHVRRDQTDKNIDQLQQRADGEPHTFVKTPERIAGAFEIFGNCARVQVAKLESELSP